MNVIQPIRPASDVGRRPADHPPVRAGPHRRAPDESRHAGGDRLLVDAPLPQGVPVRPAGHRDAARSIWWPILNLIILSTRPGRRARDYASIWNKERERGAAEDHHPLAGREAGRDLRRPPATASSVDWAMRYGKPGDRASASRRCCDQGCDRILLVPLYPQYAAATTATACDQAFRALMEMRWQPAMRVAPPYHDDPVYIDAARSLDEARSGRARLRAGGDPRLLPRRAEGISPQGRSLSLPMREDLAAAARGASGWPEEPLPHRPSSRASAATNG